MLLAVALNRPVQPGPAPFLAGVLPAGREPGRAAFPAGRQTPRPDIRGEGDGLRRRTGPPPVRRAPGPPVGREDPVVPAAARLQLPGGYHLVARRDLERHPVPGALPG